MTADGQRVNFWPGAVLVRFAGRRMEKLTVAVSDSLDNRAVSIILGHYYMQVRATGSRDAPRTRAG